MSCTSRPVWLLINLFIKVCSFEHGRITCTQRSSVFWSSLRTDLQRVVNWLMTQVQKKKIWEGVQPHLKTNDQRQVVYKGTVMTIGAGPVMAPTLANANIS